MKPVDSNLQTHLARQVMTLATCWRIVTTAGTISGFTNHVRDLTISGTTYVSTGGMTASAVRSNEGLQVDNLELLAFLTTAFESDIDDGIYDFAEVLIFKVNYLSLADGTIFMRKGRFGQASRQDGVVQIEIRGLQDQLRTRFGFLYDTLCTAELGDTRCRVDLSTTDFTVTGTITSVDATEPARIFTDSALVDSGASQFATDYFAQGNITFTSGNNIDLVRDIRSYIGLEISCYLPFPNDVVVTDAYEMIIGCDRRFATCKDVFSNVPNFRGFPYIPTTSDVNKVPEQSR